jgi:hypothetical protein
MLILLTNPVTSIAAAIARIVVRPSRRRCHIAHSPACVRLFW